MRALLLGVLAALPVATACTITSLFAAPMPNRIVADPSFTITSGPTSGSVPIGSVTANGYKVQGKIEPPLAAGVIANITKVEKCDCPGAPSRSEIPSSSYAGGANGASFTVEVFQDALGTECKSICITYTTNEQPPRTYKVTIQNPIKRGNAVVDFGSLMALPKSQSTLIVKVVDRTGAVNRSFNGTVFANAFSTGGSVLKLNGAFGTAAVAIDAGLGTMAVDASNAISEDTVYFETHSDRLDRVRSGIVIQ